MFSVIFEVHPRPNQSEAYLGYAKMLRPELEMVQGFVDNVRYRSLTREGWVLSLSNWRDEKAVVRWRTKVSHHEIQELGRREVFLDYHLRVGQLTQDTQIPSGYELHEQRLDETETGEGTALTLINARRTSNSDEALNPETCAAWLGVQRLDGFVSWDVFDAVLDPGDIILMATWRDRQAAKDFQDSAALPEGARLRQIRVIRDYGMFDRREAPQYYPEVKRST